MTVFVIIAFSVFFSLPCFSPTFFAAKRKTSQRRKGGGPSENPSLIFEISYIVNFTALRRYERIVAAA